MLKLDRFASRLVLVEMFERLRPFATFSFVSLAVDERSSSDEYLVA